MGQGGWPGLKVAILHADFVEVSKFGEYAVDFSDGLFLQNRLFNCLEMGIDRDMVKLSSV